MTSPWITKTGLQKNSVSPSVDDLYQSPDVFANGVPIVLYAPPGESAAVAAITAATVNLDEVYFSQGSEAAAKAIQTLVTAGIMTQEQITAGNNAVTTLSSTPAEVTADFTGTNVAANCTAIHGLTSFPDSLILTPNGTTLGTLIRDVTFPKHNIVAQKGLTKAQIVCNLANLAKNIWEPLKAEFPDAFITNSFREGESQSQHGTGQAMDIQFHRLPSSRYLERAQWIKANLPYDQLLLECHTSGALWIHVSNFSGTGINIRAKPESNWVATMINGSNFVPGLRDLSTVSGVRPIPAA